MTTTSPVHDNDMINCDHYTFRVWLDAGGAQRGIYRGADAPKRAGELMKLRTSVTRGGLIPDGVIKNMEHGRLVHPETWLMVARAHKRGSLVLWRLMPVEARGGRWGSKSVRVFIANHGLARYTELREAAMREQAQIIETMMAEVPWYFEGIYVRRRQSEAPFVDAEGNVHVMPLGKQIGAPIPGVDTRNNEAE